MPGSRASSGGPRDPILERRSCSPRGDVTAPRVMSRSIAAVRGTPARRNSAGSLVIQASQRSARLITVVAAAAILDPTPFAAFALALALTDLVRSTLLAYDVSAVRLLSRGEGQSTIIGSHLGA